MWMKSVNTLPAGNSVKRIAEDTDLDLDLHPTSDDLVS